MTSRQGKRGPDLEGVTDEVLAGNVSPAREGRIEPGRAVDLSVLDEATDGDHTFERHLVELFIRDLDRHLEELERAAGCGDGDAIQRTAHSVKGAGAQVGAHGLHVLALELEALAAEGDMTRLTDCLQRLASEAANVRAALMVHLDEGEREQT